MAILLSTTVYRAYARSPSSKLAGKPIYQAQNNCYNTANTRSSAQNHQVVLQHQGYIMTNTTHQTNFDYGANDIDARLNLVDFAHITPQDLQKLCQDAIAHTKSVLDTIKHLDCNQMDSKNALNYIHTFNQASEKAERYFSLIAHLNSVKSDEIIRDIHHSLLPIITQLNTQALQSIALYELYQLAIQAPASHDLMQAHEKTALNKALLSFELSGVGLDDAQKKRFADIQNQLSILSAKFADNVLDATDHYYLPLNPEQTAGLSPNALKLLADAKAQKQSQGLSITSAYVATLDLPIYLAVMQYADDRNLRKTLYKAYITRASALSPLGDEFDNSDIMQQILSLREQKAQILHKKLPVIRHYADISLAPKMANCASEVLDFLYQLSAHAKPIAMQEYQELQALGKTLGIHDIQAWDIAYLSEKLRLEKYAINNDTLKNYFPINQVLTGLFDICQDLFDIRFTQKQVPTWHDDVLFYEVHDSTTDELLGALYLDLYARTGKRDGAWLSGFQNREALIANTLPVGFIVGNFTPPIDDKPALLTFDEVLTVFHEFGHGLHHLLTQINIGQIAGINGVEWDAVELPSQFLENFASDKLGIVKISRHIDTGESLPDDMLFAIIQSKNFQSGIATIRQLEFAIFDMLIHNQAIQSYDDILAVMAEVRKQIGVIPTPSCNRFANSFNHIFAGGYASGYYSYKWAELLSADAFAKFEENGIFDKATGLSFRQEILAQGSSRPARDNFIAFRGRAPTIDALLRHSGFKPNDPIAV